MRLNTTKLFKTDGILGILRPRVLYRLLKMIQVARCSEEWSRLIYNLPINETQTSNQIGKNEPKYVYYVTRDNVPVHISSFKTSPAESIYLFVFK
jgi:hypothetical protein